MDFKQGKEYLVIALQGKDGTWSTSVCARTRAVEYAADEIEALRARSRGEELPRKIYGDIYDARSDDLKPLSGVPLILRSGDEERKIVTDPAGYFRFTGLNPKVYSLSSERPDIRIWRKEIDLVHDRCANVSGSIENGR
jgi:hypothetical protein